MIKDIKYQGYSAVPSDYECSDGQLATSLNLISEDGQLHTLYPPGKLFKLGENESVAFIHKTYSIEHLIIINTVTNSVRWMDVIDNHDGTKSYTVGGDIFDFDESIKIYQFNAIGNTFIVLTNTGIHYFLWKHPKYEHLGNHIPEVPLSFGLKAEALYKDFTYEGEYTLWSDGYVNTSYRDQTMGEINSFITAQAKKHKFVLPFFVRYCYRLYDGSVYMASSPILMLTASGPVPWLFLKGYGDLHKNAQIRLFAAVHTLDYACTDQYCIDLLKKWKDIVTSVDVYISKPIYKININDTAFKWYTGGGAAGLANIKSICKRTTNVGNHMRPANCFPAQYQYTSYFDIYDLAYPESHTEAKCGDWYIKVPERDEEDFEKDLRNCHDFYLLTSIPIDELSIERKDVPMPKEEQYMVTETLVQKENLSNVLQDYKSHDTLVPHFSYVYNNRLNCADMYRKLFYGFKMDALLPYTDGYVFDAPHYENGQHYSDKSLSSNQNRANICYYFFIKEEDEKEYVVAHHKIYYEEHRSGDVFGRYGVSTPVNYIFFPNSKAYKCIVIMYISDNPDGTNNPGAAYQKLLFEIPLTPHDFLDGAYWFDLGGIEQGKYYISSVQTPALSENTLINITGKIYTSEVNNPFVFPVTGINTIGTGVVKAICSATKALSQGQFGQFPLYAFTDEGVWALEVSSTGTYSAKQPITRDVCINTDSVTQLDSSVLFATSRGIMLISGSDTMCVSDAINTETPFDVRLLPGMDKLHAMLGDGHNIDSCIPIIPFTEFLQKCGLLYDYVHQRVIVYHPEKTYAYVFSLKSKQWGMMYSNILSGINSYPDALAVDKNNNLVNFALPPEGQQNGLIVTRPLKLEIPDVLKTMDTVIQRGHFVKGHVQAVLYGSRDLYNWHLIWSSKDHYLRGFRGTPYKYFRIACITALSEDESLFGASLQFTPRQTNQPR